MDVAALVYQATELLPATEKYGLKAQMRSAAVSVSSNIAEGCGRPSRADLARFLGIAIGSACEVESQLLVSCRLGFLDEEEISDLVRRTGKLRKELITLYGRVKKGVVSLPEESRRY